jgi:hypothetical protein
MLSTNDQVAKLQVLLARVQANANQPGVRLAHRWPGRVWGGPVSGALPLVAADTLDVAATRPTAPPAPSPAHMELPVATKPQAAAPAPAVKAPAVPAFVAAADAIGAPPPLVAKPVPAAKPAVPARPPVPAARPKVPSRTDETARSSVTSSPTPVAVAAQAAPVGAPALPLLRSPSMSDNEDEATIVAGKGYDSGAAASRQAAILAAVARHTDANRQSESNIAGSTAATVSAAVSFGAQSGAEPRAAQLEPVVLKTSLPDEPEVANFIGLGPTTGAETIADLLAAALSF